MAQRGAERRCELRHKFEHMFMSDAGADLTVAIFGRRREFFWPLDPWQRPKKAK